MMRKHIFLFTVGVLIAGFTTWYMSKIYYERNIELVIAITEVSNIERNISWLSLDDETLRCRLSKYASFNIKELKDKKVSFSNMKWPFGVREKAQQDIDGAISLYESRAINEYAKNCRSKTVVQ